MPHNQDCEGAASGLFSNLFSFVSREVKSFALVATGGEAENDNEEQPVASTSRVKLSDKKVKGNRSYRERPEVPRNRRERKESCVEDLDDDQSSRLSSPPDARHQRRRHAELREERNRTRHAIIEEEDVLPSPRVNRRRPIRMEQEVVEEELSCSERQPSPTPPPPPPPPQQLRRRRQSITMPGALFGRDPSLELSPDPDWEKVRVVRFAAGVESPVVSRIGDRLNTDPKTSRSTPRPVSLSNSESEEEYEEEAALPNLRNRPPSLAVPDTRAASPHETDSSQDQLDVQAESRSHLYPVLTDKGKGKEKQAFSSRASSSVERSAIMDDHSSGQISFETRMKGKERELVEAQRKEHDRDSDSTSLNESGWAKDKERIKALEDEVKKLREELAKKSRPCSIPPAPPPPPPPPRPGLVVSSGIKITPGTGRDNFASARASLKHTGTPVENPINPAIYGSAASTKRRGQPTLNVGADKMMDFLKELKAKRLRKIANAPDGSFVMPAPPERSLDEGRPSNLSTSSEEPSILSQLPMRPPRPLAGPSSQMNGKRKRPSDAEHDSHVPSSIKRRTISSCGEVSDRSNTSIASSSKLYPSLAEETSIPKPSVRSGTFSLLRSAPIRTTSGSFRTETDLTTPSLCSDTEQDGDPSLDDRPPSTPPMSMSGASRSISLDESHHPTKVAENLDPYKRKSATTKSTSKATDQDDRDLVDTFSRRPPSSPMLLDSPRKPKAPGRGRLRLTPVNDDNSDDDPLTLSRSSARRDHVSTQTITEGTRVDRSSRKSSVRSNKSNGSTASRGVSQAPSTSSTSRATLYNELLRAEDTDLQLELESGVFTGSGLRSKKQGFLAHGGAGGVPVMMGLGTSEEVEESDVQHRGTGRRQRSSTASTSR